MAYRILIPLDGSSRAERAVPVVDRLAEALGAEVEVLRVVDPTDDRTTPGTALMPESVESRMRRARHYLHDAADRFRRVKPTATRVQQGSASDEIALHASAGSFDLIVMSSHGYAGLAGAMLGSVALAVVRESAIPVLVLRERVALPLDPRGLNVVVPLDGSNLSEAVLAPLLPLARALDWRLVLLRVTDVVAGDLPGQQQVVSADESTREAYPEIVAYLETLAENVRARGVRTDVRIGFGDCGACIVRFAAQASVDLIAMTTHARHGFGRLVLGSVTEHVVCHAGQPVLAVRPPGPREAARLDRERLTANSEAPGR